ncbi:MAG TPA: septal ring lytic transglycosylase RlpA family protein [Arenibaculum sp.]|nr:septal ring lytic transglycosylase RlpA family protein [Arenibaculum sp.]
MKIAHGRFAVAALAFALYALSPGGGASAHDVEEDGRHVEVGTASWYGPGLQGNTTASGDVFDQNALTAAHPTLPMATEATVTNLENGRTVDVEINDRGPFAQDRVIDLSKAAAEELDMTDSGTAEVRIEAETGSASRAQAENAKAE